MVVDYQDLALCLSPALLTVAAVQAREETI